MTTVVRPSTYTVKSSAVTTTSMQQHQQHVQAQQQQQLPSVSAGVSIVGSGPNAMRQPTGPIIVQKSMSIATATKSVVSTTPNKTIITTANLNKPTVPSVQPKPIPKEKEKKTFSSAGYT